MCTHLLPKPAARELGFPCPSHPPIIPVSIPSLGFQGCRGDNTVLKHPVSGVFCPLSQWHETALQHNKIAQGFYSLSLGPHNTGNTHTSRLKTTQQCSNNIKQFPCNCHACANTGEMRTLIRGKASLVDQGFKLFVQLNCAC